MGGHDDQVGVLRMSQIDDRSSGIAVENERASAGLRQVRLRECAKLTLGLFRAAALDVGQHGARDFHAAHVREQGSEDVNENDFRREMGRQHGGVAGWAYTSLGEIDRKENLRKRVHDRLLYLGYTYLNPVARQW